MTLQEIREKYFCGNIAAKRIQYLEAALQDIADDPPGQEPLRMHRSVSEILNIAREALEDKIQVSGVPYKVPRDSIK